MTSDELRQAGLILFGPDRGWQSRLAEALGIDRASVTRYLSGQVPGPVAAAMTCWLAHYRRTGEKPSATNPNAIQDR